jgi:spore maturation protein CgeB
MNVDILKKYNNNPGAKKVLFAPINTLSVDFCDAFVENDFEVYSLNFAGDFNHNEYMKIHKPVIEQKFLKACEDIKPDWVYLMMDTLWFSPNVIINAKKASPKTIFTNWTGDVREKPKPGVIEIGKVVDITLIVSTGQIEMYKQHGLKRVEFLQAGLKPCFFPLTEGERKKLRDELKHDIVFCANNSQAFPGASMRSKVVSKLSKTFGNRFAVYGGGWKKYSNSWRKRLTYDDQQKVYNGSKIVISINNFNDIDMYFSARQLNAMATGTLTISSYIPGLEKYFDNKKDLVWFKTADECVKLVKYYLEHEDEACQIGINGSNKILKYHTRIARIKEMRGRLGL